MNPSTKDLLSRLTDMITGQRLKSKMEVLESFRDTVTAATLSAITSHTPEVHYEPLNRPTTPRSGPLQVIAPLPVPSLIMPVLEKALECNEALSYFDCPQPSLYMGSRHYHLKAMLYATQIKTRCYYLRENQARHTLR